MSQRTRIALIFAAVAAAGYGVLATVVWLALRRAGIADPDQLASGASYAALAALLLAALIFALWLFVDRTMTSPAERLARDVQSAVQMKFSDRPIDVPIGRLAGVPEAVGALVDALRAARQETMQAMESATARIHEQKSWLEVILLDLSEGVVVCNANHQILLYNQAAVRMFGAPEMVGLGRSLFGLVTRQPVLHTLERLGYRRSDSPPREAGELSAPFVCATNDSRIMLQGRMALIVDAEMKVTGYVITLTDISNELAALAKSDTVRRALTRELRGPVANLRAAAETVTAFPDMNIKERNAFDEVILREAMALSERIEVLAGEYRGHLVARWPMADIYSMDLFNCVARQLADAGGPKMTMVGIPLWLHGDSHSLMLALEFLIRELAARTGVGAFDVEALLGDRRVYVDVIWQGEPIAAQLLEEWQDVPLEAALGNQTVRDILDRHGSDLWSQSKRFGQSFLRIPLLAPLRPQFVANEPALPPRPEFYDFGLMHEHSQIGDLGERRLHDLTYVVFDTETTGLHPTEGDEIISLAGVRVVKGRVLTGESFERLVNPGRSIPPESIRFHGITDEMVKDKPPIRVVLPQFRRFAGESILVAHNAAFDLKFLKLKEEESGISFTNPVLDTLLLSALAQPEYGDHSLDAAAQRLGIEVTARHTAMGDTLATAEILVRLFDLLESRGIRTFGEVMRASNMAAELRLRERQF